MKLIKNDWRNKLGNQSLRNILQIILHTPAIKDYDPIPAIHLWHSLGERARRPEADILVEQEAEVLAEDDLTDDD